MNNTKQKTCHLRDRIFALELLTRFELVTSSLPIGIWTKIVVFINHDQSQKLSVFNVFRTLSFTTVHNMALYSPGTRAGLIYSLTEMRSYLEADENELRDLTDSTITKLRAIDDDAFSDLELYPDFTE